MACKSSQVKSITRSDTNAANVINFDDVISPHLYYSPRSAWTSSQTSIITGSWSLHFLKNKIPGHFQAFPRSQSHFPRSILHAGYLLSHTFKKKTESNFLWKKKAGQKRGNSTAMKQSFSIPVSFTLCFCSHCLL